MKKILTSFLTLAFVFCYTISPISANTKLATASSEEITPFASYGQQVTKYSEFYYGSESYTLTGKYYLSADDGNGYLYSVTLQSWSSNIPGLPYTKCEVIKSTRNSNYMITLTIKIYVMSISGNILDSDTIDVSFTSPGPR